MISIVVFPGSNCDRDLKVAIEKTLKKRLIWFGIKLPILRNLI